LDLPDLERRRSRQRQERPLQRRRPGQERLLAGRRQGHHRSQRALRRHHSVQDRRHPADERVARRARARTDADRARQQRRHGTVANEPLSKEHDMLWTLALILLILWGLGLVTSYTLGGFIHILLVVALVVVVVRLAQGRRALD